MEKWSETLVGQREAGLKRHVKIPGVFVQKIDFDMEEVITDAWANAEPSNGAGCTYAPGSVAPFDSMTRGLKGGRPAPPLTPGAGCSRRAGPDTRTTHK